MSGCPGSHDNDKREDSSGGGLKGEVRGVIGAGRIARAATEESFGSSPGSSSGVLCLWSLRVPSPKSLALVPSGNDKDGCRPN